MTNCKGSIAESHESVPRICWHATHVAPGNRPKHLMQPRSMRLRKTRHPLHDPESTTVCISAEPLPARWHIASTASHEHESIFGALLVAAACHHRSGCSSYSATYQEQHPRHYGFLLFVCTIRDKPARRASANAAGSSTQL